MKFSVPPVRFVVALGVLSLATACANKHPRDKPAELTKFSSTATIDKVWSFSAGDGAPKLRLGLSLATDGKVIYTASHKGDVTAIDAASGKKLWHVKTALKLTGGPGVGDGLVVAGASHGDIVALDAATGARKWKSHINSEVLAAPAIGGGVVVVRMGDGRVVGLNAADGTEKWSAEQTVPKLSLRGTGKPAIVGNIALCGFDTGRVMALALSDGGTLWDANVSPPSGKSEIERLNDVDSAVKVGGDDIYAVNYHGKAVRINRDTGQVLWSRDVSSYAGIAIDDEGVYVSSDTGSLVKLGRRNGVELWKQEALAFRRLSPPTVVGGMLVVADYQGYVHVLSDKGELLARSHAMGARVSAAPLVVGDLLVMMDVDGKVVALRITPQAQKG